MPKKHIFVIFALLTLAQNGMYCQASCSRAQAEKADRESSKLETWQALHQSFLRYSGCDDGSIAEGYSQSVSKLLVNDWSSFTHAVSLFDKDKSFFNFVVKHVNATLTENDLKAIRTNCTRSCPTGSSRYCARINRAAERALSELR